MDKRPLFRATIGICVVSLYLLLVAIQKTFVIWQAEWADTLPSGFYEALKACVFVASAVSAIACYKASPWLSPISLALIGTGYLEMFARLKSDEWVFWNRLSIGLFSITLISCIISLARLREKSPVV